MRSQIKHKKKCSFSLRSARQPHQREKFFNHRTRKFVFLHILDSLLCCCVFLFFSISTLISRTGQRVEVSRCCRFPGARALVSFAKTCHVSCRRRRRSAKWISNRVSSLSEEWERERKASKQNLMMTESRHTSNEKREKKKWIHRRWAATKLRRKFA